MQIVKNVYFDKPGERDRLTQLAKEYNGNEVRFASAIETEFQLDFTKAMEVATLWLKVLNKKSK